MYIVIYCLKVYVYCNIMTLNVCILLYTVYKCMYSVIYWFKCMYIVIYSL